MLIDNTYFSNWNDIPNLNEPDPNNRTSNLLTDIMQQAENDVLSLAFGWEMWEDFKQWINPDGGISANAPESYKEIVTGKIYDKQVNGETKKCIWVGLLEEYPKSSLLADYTYYLYKTHKATQTTEFGEAKVDTKVGSIVSSTPKIVKAWNSFLEKFQGNFLRYASGYTLECNPYTIVNGGVDYYGYMDGNFGHVSFIQFLHDNKSQYPLIDLDRSRFKMAIKNSWGI